MTTPQPGIFRQESRFHHALEYAVPESSPEPGLRTALKNVLALARADAPSEVSLVIAFGSALWPRLAPDHMPDGLIDYPAIDGWEGTASPSTQRDLLVWLHGPDHDGVIDAALSLHGKIKTVAELQLEQAGYLYRDSRDLTGFIDGTANPKEGDIQLAALIPAGKTETGGSFVLTQRWLHDLDSFNALPVAEQERIIGRTKPDSIELEGDAMPPDSHVSRTDVKVGDVAQKIYRRSFPFGGAAEHGLYFLAFSCEISRFTVQLERMFGASGDGHHDRLIEFSRPVTGSYWFAPSLETLTDVLS